MKGERVKALLRSRWGRLAFGLSLAVKIVLLILAAMGAAGEAHAQTTPAEFAGPSSAFQLTLRSLPGEGSGCGQAVA